MCNQCSTRWCFTARPIHMHSIGHHCCCKKPTSCFTPQLFPPAPGLLHVTAKISRSTLKHHAAYTVISWKRAWLLPQRPPLTMHTHSIQVNIVAVEYSLQTWTHNLTEDLDILCTTLRFVYGCGANSGHQIQTIIRDPRVVSPLNSKS